MHLLSLLFICAIALAVTAEESDLSIGSIVNALANMAKPENIVFLEPTCRTYEDLGTFCRNGSWSTLNRLPTPVADLKTKFVLVTSPSQTYDTAEILDYKDPSTISKSAFDPKVLTRFYAHGWTMNGRDSFTWKIRDAMFAKEKVNFIIVDWMWGAAGPDYWRAASNTPLIGAQLAKTIQALVQSKGATTNNIELLGFSMGGQIVGFVQAKLKEYGVKTPVKKILSIDPAGPLFEGVDPVARISLDDAPFVEVLHTNGAPLLQYGIAMFGQGGHLDFYPNGGQYQPGCWPDITKMSLPTSYDDIAHLFLCQHFRALEILLESFAPKNCSFESYSCDTFDNFRKGLCRTPQYTSSGSNMNFYFDQKLSPYKQFYLTSGITPLCSKHVYVSVDIPSDGWPALGVLTVNLIDSAGKSVSITVLDKEAVVPGKTSAIVALSSIAPADVVSAKISYIGTCTVMDLFTCIKLKAVHIESMDGSDKKVACGSSGLKLPNLGNVQSFVVKTGAQC